MKNTYGDIPDFPTKKYFPMSRNLMITLYQSGWEYLKMALTETVLNFKDIVNVRLDDSINTSKDIMEDKMNIPPELVFTFSLFVPVLGIRSDLQQGTNVLLFGNSCDVSFASIDDLTGEIKFILNNHLEQGLPTNWFIVNHNDELLNRRHLKLGYKIKDIPKKTKKMKKSARYLIDILKDIRNERTPQWKNSDYYTVLLYSGGMCNAGLESSNYEILSYVWEGVNIDKTAGWRQYFLWYPWPTFLQTIMRMPRKQCVLRMAGLISSHKHYINQMQFPGICGNPGDWFMDTIPETIDKLWYVKMDEGLPTPAQTLGYKAQDWREKKVFDELEFDYEYPKGEKITPEGLGMSKEELLRGVYLDINHETSLSEKIDETKIISKGMGRSTELIREP
ncbi:MAG: hypothetical protein GF329_09470 [Candidatus Lokiarchaeota archaeon]|nr:hypothetical protein [Candidatus Lokiarchaeota archaeon]